MPVDVRMRAADGLWDAAAPPDPRSTVIKLTLCLRRKPDLTVEEFQRYWREVHAPLVAERAEKAARTARDARCDYKGGVR